jgi:hypothetical protein
VEKIQMIDAMKITGAFERTVTVMYADGKIDVDTMKAILIAHEREMQTAPVKPASESRLPG